MSTEKVLSGQTGLIGNEAEQQRALVDSGERLPDRVEATRFTAEAEVKAAIILARQFPRNEMAAYDSLIQSCKRPAFAQMVRYSFPRGSKKVTGPSINLAREAARLWGNIRYGVSIVEDNEEKRTIDCWAWDLETNTKISMADNFGKLIQRYSAGQGASRQLVWIACDERDLRELTNRHAAIGIRNSLLQLLPRDIIDDAIEQATVTLRGQASKSMKEAIKDAIDKFSTLKVSLFMLERYLRHPLAEVTPDEIVELSGIYQSIKDGNSQISETFHGGKPETNLPQEKSLDETKARIKEDDDGYTGQDK